MNLFEKLPVALSGLCLVALTSAPVMAQGVELSDDFDGSAPMQGVIEISMDGEGPDFFVAGVPNSVTTIEAGAAGFAPAPEGFAPGMRGGWGGPSRGGMRGCPAMSHGGGFMGIRDLDLSDEQYEKFYSLKNSFMDKVGPKMFEIRTNERHLKDLLTQTSVDTKKAKDLQGKINDLRADISNLKLDHCLAMQDVLSAEQRKKIRERVIRGGGHHGGSMMRRMKMEKKDS
ncbi:MAG: Spy/CpxP family protein refolding chaperone [Leptolyngbya sp.]|nr:Spy/CpxP family protein refolding chaperone [Candidatus Melainabacteria bacterium]